MCVASHLSRIWYIVEIKYVFVEPHPLGVDSNIQSVKCDRSGQSNTVRNHKASPLFVLVRRNSVLAY
jgi:hypothetical protein